LEVTHILIDYENVPLKSLGLLGGEQYRVHVFLGPTNTKLPTEFAIAIQEFGDRAKYVVLEKAGHNALDFHITYYLGSLVSTKSSGRFRIISKDTGFDSLIEHLRIRQIDVERFPTIHEMLGIPLPADQVAKKPIATPVKAPAKKAVKVAAAKDPAKKPAKVASKKKKASAIKQKQGAETAKVKAAAPIKTVDEWLNVCVKNLQKQKRGKSQPTTVKALWSTIKSFCGKGVPDAVIDEIYAALVAKGYVLPVGTKVDYKLPH
jgi:hypothetical protein